MINLKNVKTIFFDYDGTLHSSMKIYGPAFKKAYSYLVENKLAEPKVWKEEEISYWLGFGSKEMWQEFMPNLPEETKIQCRDIIAEEMKSRIEQGKAVLYDGALETLEYLKNKGYHLVFISNCRKYYRDSHDKLFNLSNYFQTMLCSEEYDFIPKYEILDKVKHNYPEEMAIVGDRKHDMEAGRKNGIYTIGCKYGFGLEVELQGADIIIYDISDLKNYF
ncbi:HAD family hydrolase [Clostridium sp. DJ247]|uniref:HAD family hydrolase n=1 Tax=Clostridium sp. DJ247 TaxID=2726188 RepID=UPI001628B53E|nr:HAD family hydrolase [Clostridium sp. DJ247]MBC2582362.1 HAD family hydrolase [Clostridium sp. DJ247]